MSRAVTADHVIFDEAINEFRPSDETNLDNEKNSSTNYLLLSFNLPSKIVNSYFEIEPSIEVRLPRAYSGFIAKVKQPKWTEFHNNHLYTIALSSIFSFIAGKPVKSPRDDYYSGELNEHKLNALAIQFPILTAGPGSHDTRLAQETSNSLKKEINEICDTLYNIPYKEYLAYIRAIRLVHLAHINRRDDFGLAYFLIISAIESIAQIAITRNSVKDKPAQENVWKKKADDDEIFRELFHIYKEYRGHNKYLKRRFVKFILKYCPIESWDELDHPHKNLVSYLDETNPKSSSHDWITNKTWWEVYPSDLEEDEIEKLLEDAYNHRSAFTHRGENPPHRDPQSLTRYFQDIYVFDEQNYSYSKVILPNFRLMSFIAKKAISNYYEDKFPELSN